MNAPQVELQEFIGELLKNDRGYTFLCVQDKRHALLGDDSALPEGGSVIALTRDQTLTGVPYMDAHFVEYAVVASPETEYTSFSPARGSEALRVPVFKQLHIRSCTRKYGGGGVPREDILRIARVYDHDPREVERAARRLPCTVREPEDLDRAGLGYYSTCLKGLIQHYSRGDEHVGLCSDFRGTDLACLEADAIQAVAVAMRYRPYIFCFPALRDEVLMSHARACNYPFSPLFRRWNDCKPYSWLAFRADVREERLRDAHAVYENVLSKAVLHGGTLARLSDPLVADVLERIGAMVRVTWGQTDPTPSHTEDPTLPFSISPDACTGQITMQIASAFKMEEAVCESIARISGRSTDAHPVMLVQASGLDDERGDSLMGTVLKGGPMGVLVVSASAATAASLRAQTGLEVLTAVDTSSVRAQLLDEGQRVDAVVIDSCHCMPMELFRELCAVSAARTSVNRLVLVADFNHGHSILTSGFDFGALARSGAIPLLLASGPRELTPFPDVFCALAGLEAKVSTVTGPIYCRSSGGLDEGLLSLIRSFYRECQGGEFGAGQVVCSSFHCANVVGRAFNDPAFRLERRFWNTVHLEDTGEVGFLVRCSRNGREVTAPVPTKATCFPDWIQLKDANGSVIKTHLRCCGGDGEWVRTHRHAVRNGEAVCAYARPATRVKRCLLILDSTIDPDVLNRVVTRCYGDIVVYCNEDLALCGLLRHSAPISFFADRLRAALVHT